MTNHQAMTMADLPPCECGSTKGEPLSAFALDHATAITVAHLECAGCGKHRVVRFRLSRDGRLGWTPEDQKP